MKLTLSLVCLLLITSCATVEPIVVGKLQVPSELRDCGVEPQKPEEFTDLELAHYFRELKAYADGCKIRYEHLLELVDEYNDNLSKI